MSIEVQGWGRFPRSQSEVIPLSWLDQDIPFDRVPTSFLAHGMGRSYGDSCLNDGNTLLSTAGLDRLIRFDALQGILTAESGVTFDAILRFAIPRGWFVPVTPGTRFITLGGAIANDVHGKNHHCAGTFGQHVLRFQLRRSDGTRMVCSRSENADWFRATIGGLGLTGLIEWAEFKLRRIRTSWVDTETIRYGGLDEFRTLSAESEASHEYVVAWVDSLARSGIGRGLFMRGNHNADSDRYGLELPQDSRLAVPAELPFKAVNRLTLKLFNTAFYRARLSRRSERTVRFEKYFYPLDSIGSWNKLYGRGGLIQWQALVPLEAGDIVRDLLAAAGASGSGSFLTVMKIMGEAPPAGLLSFSGRGITLALDFPYDASLLETLDRLDDMVAEAGGRLYPAKDARMSGANFRRYYPNWTELLPYVDPRFSSSFWRRVSQIEQ